MAGQRLLGINAIRANPNVIGHSLTGTLDQGMTAGHGVTTRGFFISVFKALVLDHDVGLLTADGDFGRLRGLCWFNPITGNSRANLHRTESSQALAKADQGCGVKLRP